MKQKNLLLLAAAVAGGYLLYRKYWRKPTSKSEKAMQNFMNAAGRTPVGTTVGMPRGCAGNVFYVAGSTPGKCRLGCNNADGDIIFPQGYQEFPCPEGV
jgi:hypothetical protein